MTTLSLSEAKMKLSELVEKLGVTGEPVVVTKNGRPAAVLVTPDEFAGWQETIDIKSNAEWMREIRANLKQLKAGKAKLYSLDELL